MNQSVSTVSGYVPDWPCPETVKSFITCRRGGHSQTPYDSNNLALHVGDKVKAVLANRCQLMDELGLSTPPVWLNQVHGNTIVPARHFDTPPNADGCYSDGYGVACTVLTADCLPILFCNRAGTRVAAIHAGWRGLQMGIIDTLLTFFDDPRREILVYLGPAISRAHYEVGPEIIEELAEGRELDLASVTEPSPDPEKAAAGHVLLDLAGVARLQLNAAGVEAVYGGDRCTFEEEQSFYSYRRDGETGRMASLIWLDSR